MDLSQFTIGKARLDENKIYLGKLDKKGRIWLHKKDVTQEFMQLMLDYIGVNKAIDFRGSEGSHYELTCKKLK